MIFFFFVPFRLKKYDYFKYVVPIDPLTLRINLNFLEKNLKILMI
jgi:hypothetical protein